ncbi:MAG: C1 family peptidase [Leptonema sp. (in: bacteria)]
MKLYLSFLLIFISCITVDESGKIIQDFTIFKEKEENKWKLSDIPLGPRWSENDKTIPLLILPREENLPLTFVLEKLPKVSNQGKQASSTAFASGYLAMSYYYRTKKNKKNYICSPSFIYNILNNGKDEGIEIYDSLTLLKNTGCPPIEYFTYKEYDYKIQPSSLVVQIANDYKILEFVRMDPLDMYQVATFIKKDFIIITTIYISENFLSLKEKIYEPKGKFLGKHTLAIIGYDLKNQFYYLMNSFGDTWGKKGIVLISKNWYDRLVVSAYVILK